jgi:putative oxidoreductase
MFKNYYFGLLNACLLLVFVALIIIIIHYAISPFSATAFFFAVLFSLLTVIFLLISYKSPRIGYLLSFFSILVVIRILGENRLYSLLPFLLAFFILIVLFFYIVYQNIKHFEVSQRFPYGIPVRLSPMEWHLVFVRMYIGYDLIAHSAEKLFSGLTPFLADVKAFAALGIANPAFFVKFAGFIELVGAITLGLGFFTRIGSIVITLYLLVATILGHHFQLGFIWANPGGGWEYPVMWAVLILSFSVLGDAGKYSIDSALQEKFKLPVWIKKLMGSSIIIKS